MENEVVGHDHTISSQSQREAKIDDWGETSFPEFFELCRARGCLVWHRSAKSQFSVHVNVCKFVTHTANSKDHIQYWLFSCIHVPFKHGDSEIYNICIGQSCINHDWLVDKREKMRIYYHRKW